jgi:hypothetical protein
MLSSACTSLTHSASTEGQQSDRTSTLRQWNNVYGLHNENPIKACVHATNELGPVRIELTTLGL